MRRIIALLIMMFMLTGLISCGAEGVGSSLVGIWELKLTDGISYLTIRKDETATLVVGESIYDFTWELSGSSLLLKQNNAKLTAVYNGTEIQMNLSGNQISFIRSDRNESETADTGETEEPDAARKIWLKMAEVGKADLSQAWDMEGLYSLGEDDANAQATLFLTKDQSKLSGAVSWRNYPTEERQITEQYFPMLKCLMLYLDPNLPEEEAAAWIASQEPMITFAFSNNHYYKSETKSFGCYELYVQYDNRHNELYCLITCTEETTVFRPKEE